MYFFSLGCVAIFASVVKIITKFQTSEVLLYFPNAFLAAVETSYSATVDLLVTNIE
jgi:hypothetical protein